MHDVKNYAIIVCNGQPTRSAGSNYNDCNHFLSNRPTGSSGIRHSLKQYGGKHFILNPLNPGNFAVLKLFGPSSVHCLARER